MLKLRISSRPRLIPNFTVAIRHGFAFPDNAVHCVISNSIALTPSRAQEIFLTKLLLLLCTQKYSTHDLDSRSAFILFSRTYSFSSSFYFKIIKAQRQSMADRVVFPGDAPGFHVCGAVQHNTTPMEDDGQKKKKKTKKDPKVTALKNKRYEPVEGDEVIGVVQRKMGEAFRVDIGAASPATLEATAFNGATRKNRPALAVGDYVFCRVMACCSSDSSSVVQVTCVDERTAKTWSSGELVYGTLLPWQGGGSASSSSKNNESSSTSAKNNGTLFREEGVHSRSAGIIGGTASGGATSSFPPHALLHRVPGLAKLRGTRAGNALLAQLGRTFRFEVAVGANARLFVVGERHEEVHVLCQFLERSGVRSEVQNAVLLARLVAEFGETYGQDRGSRNIISVRDGEKGGKVCSAEGLLGKKRGQREGRRREKTEESSSVLQKRRKVSSGGSSV